MQYVLVNVVAHVNFAGVFRPCAFPRCLGFGDFDFRVMVSVVTKVGEEKWLIQSVVEFGLAPRFPCSDVFLSRIGVNAPFSRRIASSPVCIGKKRMVEVRG